MVKYERWCVSYSPHRANYTLWLTPRGWSEPQKRGTYPCKDALMWKNYYDACIARNAQRFGKVRRVHHFDFAKQLPQAGRE